MNYGYYIRMDGETVIVEYFAAGIKSDRIRMENLLKGFNYA